jgi:hypothetical protein
MKKQFLLLTVLTSLVFTACKKDSSNDSNYGTQVNTWTFTEGSKVYRGHLYFDPILNTYLQANNSYTFALIGEEKTSGYVFNIVLSLLDLNFTVKTYQSGLIGNDYLNSFYYTVLPGSLENIYQSSNIGVDPNAVMTYTVTSYDGTNDIVTITFSGKALDKNGNLVNITNGRVTGRIERI